jgi:very-short-patch-repair endonuclease
MFKRAEPKQIARAQRLRREMTEPEKRLWWKLRDLNRRRRHFRRQAPFDRYVLDFVEHDAKLVVELDGSQHGFAPERVHDEQRDAFLLSHGYLTLRFWNHEVCEDLDRIAEIIFREIEKRQAIPKDSAK